MLYAIAMGQIIKCKIMAEPSVDDDDDTYQDDDNKRQKYADGDNHDDYQRRIYAQYM